MRTRPVLALTLVLVLLLVAAGCNDAGSTALSATDTGATTESDTAVEETTSTDPSTTTTTTEPTTTTTTTTTQPPPADPAADQATADAAVAAVTTELETQGFAQVPPEEDGEGSDDMPFSSPKCQEFAAAFPEDDTDLPGQTAEAEVELQKGGADPTDPEQSVEVSVAFVEDPAELDRLLDLFDDPRLEQCMEEAFTEGMATGEGGPAVELPDLKVERFDPGAGDRSLGLRMSGTFTMSSFEFPFVFELELVQVDHAAISIATGVFGAKQIEVDGAAVRELILAELG